MKEKIKFYLFIYNLYTFVRRGCLIPRRNAHFPQRGKFRSTLGLTLRQSLLAQALPLGLATSCSNQDNLAWADNIFYRSTRTALS